MTVQTRRIRAARPNVLRSIVSLGLLIIAVLFFMESNSGLVRGMSWFCAAFTCVVAVRLFVRTAFAPDITLSDQTFSIAGLKKRPPVQWTSVARFGLVKLRRETFIMYALKGSQPRTKTKLSSLRGLPLEADGYFPTTKEMSADELMTLLNTYKARAAVKE